MRCCSWALALLWWRARAFVTPAPDTRRSSPLRSQTLDKTVSRGPPKQPEPFWGVNNRVVSPPPQKNRRLSPEARQEQLFREMRELTQRGPRSCELYPSLPDVDVEDWRHSATSHLIDLSRPPPCADPFALVKDELRSFADEVQSSLTISEDTLRTASRLYFDPKQMGKRFRPTIVSLLARALKCPKNSKHRKLGRITEMIHVASLIHDDLLDDADTRRGGDAVHVVYSNKVAVFTGDYLLARASVLLAQLGDVRVVNTMASALDSLVSGEVMQIKVTRAAAKKKQDDGDETFFASSSSLLSNEIAQKGLFPGVWEASRKIAKGLSAGAALGPAASSPRRSREEDREELELYLKKSYFKTASLICDSSKSAAYLAGFAADSPTVEACEAFGFHLGLAFQIIDDVLDFAVDSTDLGKPAGADLSLGLATAPILYATREYPQLRTLIDRRFKGPGDVTTAYDLVRQSDGMRLARKLALFHAQQAVDALCRAVGEASPERDALISLAYLVLTRAK